MVENQLDMAHLPFIHHNTIGRGGKAVVDGPLVRWVEENVLNLWVYNRLDDGTPVRRAEELPEPTRPPFLVLNFPNLWENRISEDLRILAAFVPVDENNSVFYIRNYQRFVKAPILRNIFDFFQNIGSRYILHQDKRVVLRQIPNRTELKKMGEKLVPGDGAILAFRKRRQELKVQNGQLTD
jgi:phenylpropionate dioxygenase-like ring-hydroxylating dioxygenase large terminal subunit